MDEIILELEKDLKELKDRKIKIGKELKELSAKPRPLPRPKQAFHEKPGLRKFARILN